MTLTLELDAREQAALEAKAARLGVPVERFALGVLMREVERDGDLQEHPTRDAAIRKARGLLAGLPGGVDEFLRERHEEAEREMKKDAA